MKKFNGFEKGLIVDALNYYVANLEAEVEEASGDGVTIVAPGFYTMAKNELIDKVESLTKKSKQMQVPFRVLEINGDKAVLRSRPHDLIVPVSRLVYTTTGKEFARIKKVYK